MLILGRNCGQSIMIGDDITITVVGVSGAQVRLGITAPQEVMVHREEVHCRIKENKKNLEQEEDEKNE